MKRIATNAHAEDKAFILRVLAEVTKMQNEILKLQSEVASLQKNN